jgi:hypothetical protein
MKRLANYPDRLYVSLSGMDFMVLICFDNEIGQV